MLAGQYCGQCGQRASSRLISLWELVRDAFGDLFELDSRLWRTLRPLLLRPGLLTRDYLEGRRARYMPPFRMYLVLSLIFFVVAFFNPREELAIFYEPEPEPTAEELDAEEQEKLREQMEARDEANEVLQRLAEEGVLDEEILDPDSPSGVATDADENDEFNVTVNGNDMFGDCDPGEFDLDAPEWFERRMTPERMQQTCERLNAVGPGGFGRAVLDNVPAALIILLPLMALVLKLLYPLSRRYYVEHLLFFVHFHAFFFLLLILQILWARLVAMTPLAEVFAVLPIIATSFYIPVYLYKSMRRVYGQDGILTFIKFFFLSIAYLIGFSAVMLGALLLAIFSV